jgi:hypothetical protein
MRMCVVYGLCDPADGAIRYVGRTIQALEARLRGHELEPTNGAMRQWIADIAAQGRRVDMRTLETLEDGKEAAAAERRWIRQLKSNLLNATSGEDREFSHVVFRASIVERAQIEANAREAGVSMSVWMRSQALKKPRPRRANAT